MLQVFHDRPKKIIIDPLGPYPRWNGMGSTAPEFARVGKDADFGQIHFSWAKLAIEEAIIYVRSSLIACTFSQHPC